jgi:hypothetical protein
VAVGDRTDRWVVTDSTACKWRVRSEGAGVVSGIDEEVVAIQRNSRWSLRPQGATEA